jgi:hypothetical protein
MVARLNSPTDESNVKGSKVSQNHTPMACTHNNKNRLTTLMYFEVYFVAGDGLAVGGGRLRPGGVTAGG